MLLYAWVPGFYAEVERGDHPELQQRPVLVGGDPRKGGKLQAATADARAAGVREGMLVIEALERCPRARALRTRMKRYREVDHQLRACFQRETPRVEPAALGAAWLDISGGSEPVAGRLLAGVRDDLHLPLRLGAAPLKFLAKVAAERAGDGEVLHITVAELPDFLGNLPVASLPGVGPRMVERLRERGVRTARQLQALDPRVVEEAFGNHGLAIQGYALGRDVRSVRVASHRRSVSREATFAEAQLDRGFLEEQLAELARGLEGALALERLAARKLVLKVRYADQQRASRSCTLRQPVALAADLARLAGPLLDRTQAGERPIRGLGLQATGLAPGRRSDRQLELFSDR